MPMRQVGWLRGTALSMNAVTDAQSAVHGNDFELIPTAKMES